ncbi:baseplate J/gp47 family protein [bacterium]|nr:baseplate J/gp47 family protein [bacterium]
MAKVKRDISYLNKDFGDFRNQLINFSKTYFPTTYTDFSPASPGMMFMEQASYVGDVLSFYLDNQLQETFIQYARQTNNLFDLAYMFGYTPKVTSLATTQLDIFQIVPAKTVGTGSLPDFSYALDFPENTEVTGDGQTFTIQDNIDFTVSSSQDPTLITVAQVNGATPTYYLLNKKRNATSGDIQTTTFSFGEHQEFPTVDLQGTSIAQILDVFDSDGNEWYQVSALGQDSVYDKIKNTNVNDPNNSNGQEDTPYILQLKQVQRRFATRFIDNTTLQIQFGSGNAEANDEEIIPNPHNVGLGLPYTQDKLTTAYSPTNFIFTNTYGIAPSNTTLTVRYITGGGVASNVAANTLTNVDTTNTTFIQPTLNASLAQYVFDSVAVNNAGAATGGADGDSTEELRQNTISSYGTQLRNVTADDYLVRTLSMPSNFGSISKAHVQKPTNANSNTTLEIYTLSYDLNKNLRIPSSALKENLTTYLNQYKMIGDSITIKDAYIVNIAVDFEIITLPNYNNNEVIRNCLTALIEFFNVDKWQINQPIILRNINVLLDQVTGVQTVKQVIITNKAGVSEGYSQYGYDVEGATQSGVIYPSIDPSIFEVKYPNRDISGRVVTF